MKTTRHQFFIFPLVNNAEDLATAYLVQNCTQNKLNKLLANHPEGANVYKDYSVKESDYFLFDMWQSSNKSLERSTRCQATSRKRDDFASALSKSHCWSDYIVCK